MGCPDPSGVFEDSVSGDLQLLSQVALEVSITEGALWPLKAGWLVAQGPMISDSRLFSC